MLVYFHQIISWSFFPELNKPNSRRNRSPCQNQNQGGIKRTCQQGAVLSFVAGVAAALYRIEREKKSATMSTADSGTVKPLQNAMKMAKVAIQLEGENKHKVESYTWRLKW